MDGNKGVSAYVLENSIHVSASYIATTRGNVKKQFTGVMYHVMAYTWMWDGDCMAPQGLKSGMAEFVQLKAHYCNNLKDGVFVGELNGKMKDGYSRGYFRELLGKSVDIL
ncbi:hypothetical protein LINGRAHAP2_LOCUS20955 [Linum grandiflorum]